MQDYTFHFEIKDLLTQFLQAFDGAIVKRYNDERVAQSTVGVRYVYSPKQRVLFDLVDKAQHITLPCVAFNITNISRDPNRVFNKLEGQYYNDVASDTKSRHVLQPVPINISIAVSIMARYQTDMDQILSNFVPYSDPYFIISWSREGLPYKEIRTEVLWSGNLALTYPTDLNNNQPARVTCDTGFIIKGWLFKADSSSIGRIFKIDNNFYAVNEVPNSQTAVNTFNEIVKALSATDYIETVTVSARPFLAYSDRWLANTAASGTANMYGNMFDYTTAVYVSGTSGMFTGNTVLSAYSTVSSLSALYPTLTGLKEITNYTILNNNSISIAYPAPSSTGYFDIIVANPAGYGILSKDSYLQYATTQLPYANKGIQVLPS